MSAAVGGRWQWTVVRRGWRQQLCNDPDDVDCEAATAGAHTRRQHA